MIPKHTAVKNADASPNAKGMGEIQKKGGRILNAGVIIIVSAIALINASICAEQKPHNSNRPDWCRSGWVCIPTEQAADTAAQLIYLTAERNSFADRLKVSKGRRLHFDLTCGASGTLVLQDNEFDFPAGPGCTAGLAIRIW